MKMDWYGFILHYPLILFHTSPMLITQKIETIDDLEVYKASLNQEISRLTAERSKLRNRSKRIVRIKDDTSIAWCKSEIQRVSTELGKARKEIDYCSDVEARSAQVHENLRLLQMDHMRSFSPDREYLSLNKMKSKGSGAVFLF